MKRRFIECSEFVTDGNGDRFARKLEESIDTMQKRGLEVDVQYQVLGETQYDGDWFSALVLGRRYKR